MKHDVLVTVGLDVMEEQPGICRLWLNGDYPPCRTDSLSFEQSVVPNVQADLNDRHAVLETLCQKATGARLVHAVDRQFDRDSFVLGIERKLVAEDRK